MNNPMQVIGALRDALQNPAQVLGQMGLGTDAMQNPEAAIQKLMNSGRITQQQYNQAQNAVRNMMENPMIRKLFG